MGVHTVWKPTCRSLGDCFQPNIQTCMETCVNDWGNPMLIIFHPSSIYLPIDFHQVRYVSHGFFPSFFSIITQFSIIFPSFSHGFSHGFFPWIFPHQFPGLQIFVPLKRNDGTRFDALDGQPSVESPPPGAAVLSPRCDCVSVLCRGNVSWEVDIS